MRVVLVSQEYPPKPGGGGGGIGTQTYIKAHGLAERGHEVQVVSGSWDARERVEDDGPVTVHRIPEPELERPWYEESTYWLTYSMGVAAKLQELVSGGGCDIVQFPEYGAEGFVYQTDTFRNRGSRDLPSRARYVVQLHGPLAMFAEHVGWPTPDNPLLEIGCFMEGAVIRHSDLVLASSHNTAAFCAGRYGYPLERIQVIHSGIDTELFRPLPQPPDDRHPRVLFTGGLVRSKGIVALVKAVLNLRERYPDICLRVAGTGSAAFERRLREIVKRARAERHFEFAGQVPYQELPAHYAWADVFAGPSAYEPGPGNVYLEAMACARPAGACATGGAPVVVLDGRTGRLVPPYDATALAEAISDLVDDPPLRERLGTAGRDWVASRFSLERYVDRVEGLYESLLEREAVAR